MAQIFRDSIYRIIFIDIDQKLVGAINVHGKYKIELVDNQDCEIKEIDRIEAVSERNPEEAARAVAEVNMMAAGFQRRWREGNLTPLNILVCENLIDAPGFLRRLLKTYLIPEEQHLLEQTIGLIETSIGRMVSGNNPQFDQDPLAIRVEPYCRLPVDRDGFEERYRI